MMEKEKFAGVETLKETIKVKFKDADETFFKKYSAKDVVVVKDADGDNDKLEIDNEDLKELQKLEKLDQEEKLNRNK